MGWAAVRGGMEDEELLLAAAEVANYLGVPLITMLKCQLPPAPAAPGLARRALHDLPARIQPLVPTLELLVSELVTKSGTHAGLLAYDHIELAVQDGGTYLRVEVLDPGRGYDEAQAAWGHRRDDDDGAGFARRHGYGLTIVSAAAERAGVHWNMGTLTWFEFAIEPDE
jgi:hypothetical protein